MSPRLSVESWDVGRPAVAGQTQGAVDPGGNRGVPTHAFDLEGPDTLRRGGAGVDAHNAQGDAAVLEHIRRSPRHAPHLGWQVRRR